jgi:hypothetical protein
VKALKTAFAGPKDGGEKKARSWSRFYFVPGMGHRSGGTATLDSFDMLGAITDNQNVRFLADVDLSGWLQDRLHLALVHIVSVLHEVKHPRLSTPGACHSALWQQQRYSITFLRRSTCDSTAGLGYPSRTDQWIETESAGQEADQPISAIATVPGQREELYRERHSAAVSPVRSGTCNLSSIY